MTASSISISPFRRMARAFRVRFWNHVYWDRGNSSKSVLLVGAGRSGTTWIQNVINSDRSYREMFEPFYPEKVSILRGWHEYQYLRPDCIDPHFIEPARKILEGRIRVRWVDQFNLATWPDRRIVKDIRAQLILGWLRTQFPEVKIILLLRNPFSVVASQLARNWDFDATSQLLSQSDLVVDFLEPYRDAIESAGTPFERNLIRWCIFNLLPLSQLNSSDALVVYYEDGCLKPEQTVRRLADFLNMEYRDQWLESMSRPSIVTAGDSPIRSGKSLLPQPTEKFTSAQVDRGLEILSRFGMDRVYDDEVMYKIPANRILDQFSVPEKGLK